MSADSRLEKCLADRVSGGTLKREQAEAILKRVRELEAENVATMPLDEQAALAQAAQELSAAAKETKRQNAIQVLRNEELLARVAAHPRGPAAGVDAIFARDIHADAPGVGAAGGANVEGRQKAVEAMLHGKVADLLDAYRSKHLGLTRDTAGLRSLVRELYGEATGDSTAAAAARGFSAAAEYARTRWVQGGGKASKLDDWRLPQVWDRDAVSRLTKAKFSEAMEQAVADGKLRIVDWKTGKPVDAAKRAEIIETAYDRITTDGLSDMVPGRAAEGRLANSREERRAFEWTSADAWLEANARFGAGDGVGIHSLLVNHLRGMARDIGMIEVLGPSAHHQARVLIDTARKAGATDGQIYRAEARWDHVTLKASTAPNQAVARVMRETRAWLTSAKLGSAILSSINDFSTLRATAAWNGIPFTNMMQRYIALLTSPADRKAAVRTGLIAEGWASIAAAAQRNQADVVGSGLGSRVSDFVMRASGLNVHTEAGRWAFQMEMLGQLADDAAKAFAALRPEFQRGLARHGIDAAGWDLIRAAPMLDLGPGQRFLHAESIAKRGRAESEAAGRLMQWVQTEADFAIPMPGLAERALMFGKTQPGTLAGEVLRGGGQFKSFPVTMLTTHLMRGIEAYRGGQGGRYLVATGVSLTAMGALSLQMKQIAAGRDPRDMTAAKFWGAAFAQGGGAGIFGDFLYSSLSRSHASFFMNAVGGPTGGLVDDLVRLTGGNIQGLSDDKDTHFGAELARFARLNTPGTSLWYGRLALDRMMWDRLQEMADPDHARKWRKLERDARRDYGQEFWWRPGADAPQRPPDLSAITGPAR